MPRTHRSKTATFWYRLPTGCFSNTTILTASSLGSTIMYSTYRHNLHLLHSLTVKQQPLPVNIYPERLLELLLAEDLLKTFFSKSLLLLLQTE